MEQLNLTKGQSIDLKKADGTALSKIRVGLSWDVANEGGAMDLDLFVVEKTLAGKKVAFFNAKNAIAGVELSDDNRTWAGDGDDEFVKMDATKTADGEYFLALNIYNAAGKNFSMVNNAKATIYNDETNEVIATYALTQDGGSNTAVVVAKVTDAGDSYKFEAVGNYLNGDITAVAESL